MKIFDALIKDPLLSIALKEILTNFISGFGEVIKLTINTNSKTMSSTLKLVGEPDLLTLDISYEIIERNEKYYCLIKEVNTSKEWLGIAIKKFAHNLEFEIAPKNSYNWIEKFKIKFTELYMKYGNLHPE